MEHPIQQLWDELERRLRDRPSRPASVPDLINALQNKWAQIPTETIKSCGKPPRRAESVVAAKEDRLHIKVYGFECNVIKVPVGVMVMQTVFFGVCVLTDLIYAVLPSKSTRGGIPQFILTLRDGFFTALAFPVGTFVFVSFWSLYTYDRELVFPKFLDDIIPLWLNHAMHTVIMPLLLVQMYLQHHKHPSRLNGILALALFSSLYLAWVLWVHHVSDIWVYPIMARLSSVGLVLFLGAASLSMAPLYLLGEKLTQAMWSPTGNQKKKK